MEHTRAHELIEGPRGRRMLYELAVLGDPELSSFAWDVIRAFDETGSSGYVSAVFGWGKRPDTDHVLLRNRASSPDEIAERIAERAAGYLLTPAAIHEALANSVAWAMYWQPPDGTDRMLREPSFDDALLPLAERVAADPSAAWWWRPAPAEQFVVEWYERDPQTGETPRPGPARVHGAEPLRSWTEKQRAAELVSAQRRAAHPHERWSDAWWVLPHYATAHSTGDSNVEGPAGLTLVEDDSGVRRAEATAVHAADGARVLEITSPADWVELCAKHPLDVTASRRDVWEDTTGRRGTWVIPDWAAVASDYDGIHVTVAAYVRTATRALAVDAIDGDAATMLAGWDPDMTAWLNDVLTAVDPATTWTFDEVDDRWVREAD